MEIGIIDADLLGRKKHRFPNLACMKIAGYYKDKGCNVKLLLDYDTIGDCDKVFISKVFTDTYVDDEILKLNNVEYGGTGFYYDKAEPLPYEIEHHKPYYDLYKEWVEDKMSKGSSRKELSYYLDYSIGFMTRGCFRQCEFCINRNYKKVSRHSNLDEFIDKDRKYICLLDDNVLGCKDWKEIFKELNSENKRFQFKQGMDERLLSKEKCEVILNSKYIGNYIFAFDNIEDRDIIEEKLQLWNECKTNKRITKLYVFCGFDREDKYSEEFWVKDIEDLFERIKILMTYGCVPYIMRHKNYENSPFRGIYITLARWCNQITFYKKSSFRQYCIDINGVGSSAHRYMTDFENKYPNIAKMYFDLRLEDLEP